MPLVNGMTFTHEHTTIDLSGVKQNEDCNLNCFAETIEEYKKLYKQGVRNIVDVTVMGMKRNPEYVRQVAKASGINIIQATGCYTERFLPEFVEVETIEEIAERFIKEIEVGIAGSEVKAEIIGEIGSSKNHMTIKETKVFEAAVLAHKKTGKPITTHTTLGTYGHEQVEFFKARQVDLSRVVIGHVDLSGDSDYVLQLLRQGVYVEFDTIGKENYMPDQTRVDMLLAIQEAGFTDKVFLSLDITRKSNLNFRGGIGYSYLIETFIPMLREGGITEKFIQKILIDNPQTFFNL